jgi:hypothetical protein
VKRYLIKVLRLNFEADVVPPPGWDINSVISEVPDAKGGTALKVLMEKECK